MPRFCEWVTFHNLQVSEEGTEAAAATGITFELCSFVPTPELVFECPFIYAIVKDDKNILFVGQKAWR